MIMKRQLIIIALLAAVSASLSAADNSTRRERNYLREGNSFYAEKRYADAEVAYRKAIEENAASETAMFNLASSLIRQAGSADPNSGNNPMGEAQQLLNTLAQSAQEATIAELAYYNLGNMAFNNNDFDRAINMYKSALRRNPDNDKARENLRLAQLKKQEQEQNQDNQDNQDQENQDNNQNKDQDNKDQNQDQDQNKDQNQDQNKDNKDQNQEQQNQNQNQDNKDKQPPQQQPQQSISDANADKILKAMENAENATRRKVQEQEKKEAANAAMRATGRQW